MRKQNKFYSSHDPQADPRPAALNTELHNTLANSLAPTAQQSRNKEKNRKCFSYFCFFVVFFFHSALRPGKVSGKVLLALTALLSSVKDGVVALHLLPN